MQTSIIAGSNGSIAGAGQDAGQDNLTDSGILSLSPSQNMDSGLISSIDSGQGFMPRADLGFGILPLANSTNSLLNRVNSLLGVTGGTSTLPGLGMPSPKGTSLALGVNSMLNAVNTTPEIPEFIQKQNVSQEVTRVASITGYNPNATAEELVAETYALMEEAAALVGGTVDVVV